MSNAVGALEKVDGPAKELRSWWETAVYHVWVRGVDAAVAKKEV